MAHVEKLGAPWPGAVGVSGGGDSVALMHLIAGWARKNGRQPPVVLSVDHGLRPGSASDATRVVSRAKTLGLEGHVLAWRGAKPKSDLEAQARAARYRLMGTWCSGRGIAGIYLAHTLEDQAETFLLRLARGSGVDGLSAMRQVGQLPVRGFESISLIRPLLGFRRQDLRDYLSAQGEDWIEDPMNADPNFARARIRAAWPLLEKTGLTPSRISDAAAHLARARAALDDDAKSFLAEACHFESGNVRIDGDRLARLPEEIGLRVLAAVLIRVSGADYRPRFERLSRLYAVLVQGKLTSARTLHGCRIAPARKKDADFGPHTLLIGRETPSRAFRNGNKIFRNSEEN